MLDQLVESKNNSKENTRRSEFMIVTLILAIIVVLGLWTRDLYAHDYGMSAGDLELSTLVAPPPPEEEPPPKPKEEPQKQQPSVDVRKELIQNIMSSPVKPPDVIKTDPSTAKAMRLNVDTMKGSGDSNTGVDVGKRGGDVVNSGSTSGLPTTGETSGGGDEPPPPPKAQATPKPPPKMISGGVLNGRATSLPTPPYPPAARAVRASGSVSVQVVIDENGRVISASAVSGHPLLRPAAESAARGARFSPTMLSGQPVKVSGVITYNFNL